MASGEDKRPARSRGARAAPAVNEPERHVEGAEAEGAENERAASGGGPEAGPNVSPSDPAFFSAREAITESEGEIEAAPQPAAEAQTAQGEPNLLNLSDNGEILPAAAQSFGENQLAIREAEGGDTGARHAAGRAFVQIATETLAYSTKAQQNYAAFASRVFGASSLQGVAKIQSEFAKVYYADFLAYLTAVAPLIVPFYMEFAKAAFWPTRPTTAR